jgi:hypothetical protein
MGAPHSEQNLTRGEFSVPQLEHCMQASSGQRGQLGDPCNRSKGYFTRISGEWLPASFQWDIVTQQLRLYAREANSGG